ncbi:MAG: tRNA preQ1(34) S-adenosylmethionine ribosyltransferase-isomerase QueA [Phycisphaerae bacterium]|jgi:S-adenosylmethionine:tRNA ribosyltransferase-isomerase
MTDSGTSHETRGAFSLADLDYALPEDRIAQHPPPKREGSRLLLVDRAAGRLADRKITDLPRLLAAGDLVVLNDTKVLPARFTARRKTGGMVRGLFLLEEDGGTWRVMLEGSRRLEPEESLDLVSDDRAVGAMRLRHAFGQGEWRVAIDMDGSVEQVLDRIGRTPLPPYIKRNPPDARTDVEDRRRYQTVYARQAGAVAAPTAGLHLTNALLDRLRATGVSVAYVTLHVGAGTFKPIDAADVTRHHMHSERYNVSADTVGAVRQCRERGGRVVAVGTTTVRSLESAADEGSERLVRPSAGNTELFIYPPYPFRVVDAMLTNFHLPRSTLLALVMAFAGIDVTRRTYEHAVDFGYRFYSYGDAMLVI